MENIKGTEQIQWKKGMEINTIEDFKEFAKGVSRSEFERDYLKIESGREDYMFIINGEEIDCPSDIGLKEYNKNCVNCKKCWMESIEGIYFKDDIENSKLNKEEDKIISNTYNNIKEDSITYDTYDYNREYTLYEIFGFPNNTEFIYNNKFKLRVNDNHILETTDIKDIEWYQCTICREWMTGLYKLIPMEKEVTFQDILNSDDNCKCRVVHDLIKDMEADILNDYMPFDMYMLELCDCNVFDISDVKTIIRDGRWFIKSEENKYA